jgi:hypothetical protein
MRTALFASIVLATCACAATGLAADVGFAGERQLNNLVAELLEVSSVSKSDGPFTFTRASDGWIFVSARCQGKGTVRIQLDKARGGNPIVVHDATGGEVDEAVRYVAQGKHRIDVECEGDIRVDQLVVKAIPELIHCGLGFNPAIKSYGLYDMDFLRKDVLPNVTTLIVPHNIELAHEVIDGWHRQGKRFVGEVGIQAQAQTADEHFKHWAGFLDRAPFLDGIIVNEFIVNNPSAPPGATISPRRQQRMEEEQQRHRVFEDAFRQLRAADGYQGKTLYAYVGGSGKKLNQEMIGKTFVRALLDCDYRIALERYLFEVSSEQKSKEATGTPLNPAPCGTWSLPSACSPCRPGESTSSRTSITTCGWTSR